jgi:hypothetical protein
VALVDDLRKARYEMLAGGFFVQSLAVRLAAANLLARHQVGRELRQATRAGTWQPWEAVGFRCHFE